MEGLQERHDVLVFEQVRQLAEHVKQMKLLLNVPLEHEDKQYPLEKYWLVTPAVLQVKQPLDNPD